MSKRWKQLLACGLALSICFSSTSWVQATETDTVETDNAETTVVWTDEQISEETTDVWTDEQISEENEQILENDEQISEDIEVDDITLNSQPAEQDKEADNIVLKTEITVEKADEQGRYYDLTLKNYAPETLPKSISFAVWNVEQARTIWHTAEYDSEKNTYTATIDMINYNVAGEYITHCYREDADGVKTYVKGHVFEIDSVPNLRPQVTKAQFTDETKTVYQIEMSNVKLEAGERLRAAVWSDTNGQDDLKWNDFKASSDDTYTLTIPIKEYKSSGVYKVHIYQMAADGKNTFVESRSFDVPKLSAGKVSAEKNTDGTATVKLTGMVAPSGVTKVRVAIWSADNQSDMHWYTAAKDGDAWTVQMNLKNHKDNWSKYTVHAYATDGNGFESYVGGTTVDFSFKNQTPVVSVDDAAGTVLVQLEGLQFPGEVKTVRGALWSTTDGQDDLTWNPLSFDGQNTWSVEVPITKLKSAGSCVVHVYADRANGTQVYVGGANFVLEAPVIDSVEATADNTNGDFEITVSGVASKSGVVKVEAAVWSLVDKSNLKTYPMQAGEDGTYTVASNIDEHADKVGLYNIHIYVTDANGIRTVVGNTTILYQNKFESFEITDDGKETKYDLTVKNTEFPAGISGLEFAVWSETNGQDDVKWYKATANGSDYTATVDINNHKTAGQYRVHVYVTNQNGEKVYVTGSTAMIVKGTVTANIEVVNSTDRGNFDVVIKNVTAAAGVNSIRVAVWPSKDSSLVKWYDAVKQKDGTYKITVDVSNHKNYCGAYTIHVYSVLGNGIQSYTGGLAYDYEPANYLFVLKDQGNGKRTIGIYNPSDTNNVRFAVWSNTNGQDDCRWYTAKQSADGSWTATIAAKDFKDSGSFSVHAYAGSKALKTAQFDFPKAEFAKNGWYYEKYNGTTYKLYYIDDVLQRDVRNIIGKQSTYKAEVNRTTCTVTIYAKDGDNGYIIPVVAFACSVGLPSTPTPTGTYRTLAKYRWHELMGPSWGQYCTRIVGGILFHSVAGYNATSYNISAGAYNLLGQPASHGCVRLCVRDAKWIYDNCSLGMTVRIYDSPYPGPLGKPATIKIPAWQNWDPTDPAVQ